MKKICDYTMTELCCLEALCNFTPDEQRLFELRAQDVSQEDCAERMNMSISTIKRLEKDIKEKIRRETA